MTALPGIMLSVLMLAAFLLIWGGVKQARSPADRKRGILMLICAAVLIGNVLILTV